MFRGHSSHVTFRGHSSPVTIVTIAGYRPRRRARAVLALLLGALLALGAGIARAEAPKLIPYGSFPASQFAQGVAVDQSSGDVFVAALASANIDKFNASGLIEPPSPFGEGNFSGAAVNPVTGDIYVVTAVEPTLIDTYDPNTGALLSSFGVPPSENLQIFSSFDTVVQIAADSAGNVYVPVAPQNEVLEYSSTGTHLNTFTGGVGVGALKDPTGVAVDSSGNLWVADTGNNRIEELSPADAPIAQIKSEGVEDAIALDGHGDVLAIVKNGADPCGSAASPCSHLMEYSTTGVQLADVGAGSFETGNGFISLPPMVAVDEAGGRVYVSDAKGEKVWIFAPPTAPIVSKELTTEVTTSEAKLGALVNPGGIEATYRFEYGTTTAYGQSTPFPEGSVGEGLASRAVWAAASGLAPGTTYHYRVVATNEVGEAVGPDQTFTTQTAAQAACPNEALRGGFSARLPDCRAYELVTPTTKTSVQIEGSDAVAPDGDAISFRTKEPLPNAPTGGNFYAATRSLGGWSSEDLIPLESYTGALCVSFSFSNDVPAYSDERSQALISFGHDTRASEPGGSGLEKQECNAEGLQVVSGEPVGYQNLLLRDNASGAYRLVNAPPPGVTPADAHFKGASSDLSHVVFSELAPLTLDAPAGVEDLYEWDEGVLRLLTVLPGEIPAQGSLAEGNGSPAISADGSHILFTSDGGLYMRIDGERTVQVDESQGSGSSGGGSFSTMSADGTRVLFTDENKLTPDSTAESGTPDLYECEIVEEEQVGKLMATCKLSDLTVAKAGEHADVLRVSTLGSQDSSYVYFLAKGVLAEGAESGQDNLYVWDGGTITFIVTLTAGDQGVGAVSPDGAWLAFVSRKSLTGYDNTPPGGGPVEEIYLYSAATGQLVCASCNPSGEASIADAETSLASSRQRPLSDGGRLFFQTREALVPSDTNGQVDVYEYEDGQPSPISSGTSLNESRFEGASESGDDVFFRSRQQLVPQDAEEEARVIYDARVGGGIAAPSTPPPCATADACRTPVSPQPSIFGAPSSATFSGAGNLAPSVAAKPKAKHRPKPAKCKKGFVKKKGRCVKGPKKAGKSAHANRRTGK
jgi:DNA-binding beta-propeller fold protein YncE